MTGRPLRIVHVSATFPPYYGGTGTVCYHNARVLAARGHDVHVYTAAWPGQADDPPGVTVHRFRPIVRAGNAPVLPQLVRMPRDAIVHLHFPFYAGAELVALASRPYVVTYHQDVELAGLVGRLTTAHDRTIGRQVLRRAARLCPTSLDYFRSSAFTDLIPSLGDRIVPIPNGVDTRTFHPGAQDLSLRQRHGLPETMPVVLFVGSMDRAHYFKGIPTLLKALASLPEVAALFVGEGDLRSDYEHLAGDLGLSARVCFTGRVDIEELPELYRAADLFVLASETRGEAFGVVLLEAMASGCPVIATDLPGVRSVVSPGIDGFLVPPKDPPALAAAIAGVLALDPDARRAIGAAGRRKAELEYDWERIGDQLESIYWSVEAESKKRAPVTASIAPAMGPVELPIELRAAVDLVARASGATTGLIRGRLLGSCKLIDELQRYAPVDARASPMIALSAAAEQISGELIATQPAEVVTLVRGPLYRILRPLRAENSGSVTLAHDLPRATWRELGYERAATIGVQGIGAIGWAFAERIGRGLGRPDLADRSRIGMLRTLIAARPCVLAAVQVRRYRAVKR
jgi:glycosyltransferase involved in cell wall biosynthesis